MISNDSDSIFMLLFLFLLLVTIMCGIIGNSANMRSMVYINQSTIPALQLNITEPVPCKMAINGEAIIKYEGYIFNVSIHQTNITCESGKGFLINQEISCRGNSTIYINDSMIAPYNAELLNVPHGLIRYVPILFYVRANLLLTPNGDINEQVWIPIIKLINDYLNHKEVGIHINMVRNNNAIPIYIDLLVNIPLTVMALLTIEWIAIIIIIALVLYRRPLRTTRKYIDIATI